MVDIEIRTGNPEPHIDPTELVLLGEGELSTESTTRIESHLANCLRCQEELEEIQAGVAAYVGLHRSTYSETFSPPPNGWRDFEERLSRCHMEEDVQRQVLPLSELEEPDSSNPRIFGSTNRGWNDSHRVGFKWAFALGFASLVIAVGVFRLISKPGNKVSVAEIIQNASAKQARDFDIVPHPIVYQKVKIDRRARGEVPAESVVLETWKDRETPRMRERTGSWSQVSAGEADSHPIAATGLEGQSPAVSSGTIPLMMRNIRAIYESNHFAQDSPISLNNFSQWVDASPQKKQTVEELRRDGKVSAYRITAQTTGPTAENAIRSFQIEVRAEDWHPVREDLVVVGRGGEQTYEIAELDYRVAPLSEFNGHLWDPSSDIPYGVHPTPKLAQLHPTAQSGREVLIDVLSRLDQVNALTEDQIRIEREDGVVHIRGVVASEARKIEILAAFNTSTNRSNIDIDIRSALGASRSVQSTLNSKPLEAEAVAIPADPEEGNAGVRQYLVTTKHLTGAALEQEMQRFIATALDRSAQAQQHAQALKQVVMTIPEGDRQALSEVAFRAWRSLAFRHLQKVQQEVTNLRNQLAPLALGSPDSNLVPFNVAGDLDAQVKQLSEFTNRSDRTLWEVLSASSVGAPNPRPLSPSDLRSLDAETRLAVSIGQMLERNGTHH